jgi:shikimate kinase
MNNVNLRNIIKKKSYNIYLEVEINLLSKRLESSKNRPLINNINIKKKLNELITERENYYKEADLIINNDKKISDTINELKNNFQIYD